MIKVQQLSYSFYSKPLASKYVILEPSAASYQAKKASLAQECVRRLLNTSEDRSREEIDNTIYQFQDKLRKSGYSYEQQKEIIEAGLIGYKRRLERQGGIRHGRAVDTERLRERKRLFGKEEWFKGRGKDPKCAEES